MKHPGPKRLALSQLCRDNRARTRIVVDVLNCSMQQVILYEDKVPIACEKISLDFLLSAPLTFIGVVQVSFTSLFFLPLRLQIIMLLKVSFRSRSFAAVSRVSHLVCIL